MTEPRFVEATGPDVETAIKNGLERLGAQSKDVIVEVIEESNRGLFGIGGRPARVRLTLLAPPSPPKPPKPAAAPASQDQQQPPKKKRSRRRRKPRQSADGNRQDTESRSKGQRSAAPRSEKTRSESARRNTRSAAASQVADDHRDADTADFLDIKTTPPAADDEEARVATETLQDLLTRMGIDSRVEAYYVEPADENETGPLVLQIVGRDLGMLIGRRGETLASLQYITRLIVSRELQRRANIVVDVEHYKARREKRLHSLALRMAKQATQQDRTVKLEPMPAYERRIIHLSLRGRTDVYTESEGEGDSRKVTIIPVKDRD